MAAATVNKMKYVNLGKSGLKVRQQASTDVLSAVYCDGRRRAEKLIPPGIQDHSRLHELRCPSAGR